MIELVHLTKKFGDLVAVNDVTLTIPRGEFFAMLGPNAAGKTTTLKMLAGLMKPTAGAARVCGFDMQAQPLEARRRLAFVPDFPFLYDKLTPWEFFRFIGQLFQTPDAKIESGATGIDCAVSSRRICESPAGKPFARHAPARRHRRPRCCTTRRCS